MRWMDEEGFAPEFMKNKDWVTWGGWVEDDTAGPPWTKEQEEIDAVSEHIRRFFMTKTREELFDRSIQQKVLLAPCNAADDVMEDVQLKSRGVLAEVRFAGARPSSQVRGPVHLDAGMPDIIQAPGTGGGGSTTGRYLSRS